MEGDHRTGTLVRYPSATMHWIRVSTSAVGRRSSQASGERGVAFSINFSARMGDEQAMTAQRTSTTIMVSIVQRCMVK